MENNEKEISKIDKIILSDEIKKEGILKGQGSPINKNEILELFKKEESIYKISYEKIKGNEIKKGKGTGFFSVINNYPIKCVLFTNNHVLNENDIKIRNAINIEYYNNKSYIKKKIEINEKRRVFTNKELDFTNELDGIKNYFKIDSILLDNNLKNSDIFILQYLVGNELSFSYGKILSIKENKIYHSASIKEGSSGSPIIRRSKDNYIIGLNYGGYEKEKMFIHLIYLLYLIQF